MRSEQPQIFKGFLLKYRYYRYKSMKQYGICGKGIRRPSEYEYSFHKRFKSIFYFFDLNFAIFNNKYFEKFYFFEFKYRNKKNFKMKTFEEVFLITTKFDGERLDWYNYMEKA